MLIIRYIEKGVTQTTQIKQIFTDNFVHHEFLICGHLFNLCHLCAIKNKAVIYHPTLSRVDITYVYN